MRRTEELVHEVRRLIVENEELEDWISHVELHRSRVEGQLRGQIDDLRHRIRELESYVAALEASSYQVTIDPERHRSTVYNTSGVTRVLEQAVGGIVAALALLGLGVGGEPGSPIPPGVTIEIDTRCNAVLATLEAADG